MSVVKHSFIYLVSSILNRVMPFLLLPILTKYLSPSEYGTLAIFQLIISFYTAFIGMNSHMNISRNFHKYSQSQIAKLIGNILFIITFAAVAFLTVTLVVTLFLNDVFSIPAHWLQMIPILSFMFMVNTINLTILRNEGRAYLFGIFEIANTAVNMGVTIGLLLFFHYGWYSQAIGISVAYFIFFVIGIIFMQRRAYLALIYDIEEIRSILKISLPLIPHALGGIVLTISDRLFIEQMINLEAVGVYSVGYMFGMIVLLFTTSFIKAWSPWFYKSLVDPTSVKKEKIVKYTYIYILGLLLVATFIAIIGSYLLPYFVDERFYGAGEYILWISLGYAMFGAYQIFFPYLIHTNTTLFLAFNTSFAAVLNLLLNYLMIDQFGAVGAAYATLVSYSVMFVFLVIYANKVYPMPWLFLKR